MAETLPAVLTCIAPSFPLWPRHSVLAFSSIFGFRRQRNVFVKSAIYLAKELCVLGCTFLLGQHFILSSGFITCNRENTNVSHSRFEKEHTNALSVIKKSHTMHKLEIWHQQIILMT